MRSEGELSEDTLEEIHTRVMRMHTLMVEDGEDNFSRGVLLVAEKLRTSIDRPESRSRSFCDAGDTFLSMWGGMGSLGDFYVATAPAEEADARNDEWRALSNSLFSFFKNQRGP